MRSAPACGTGADEFAFATGDSSASAKKADRIADFSQAEHDQVDLSAIDADAGNAGIQHLRFIGGAKFTHSAGELRVTIEGSNTVLRADTDGDGKTDFAVLLTGSVTLTAGNLISRPEPNRCATRHFTASRTRTCCTDGQLSSPISHDRLLKGRARRAKGISAVV